ncbi:Ctf8-domain-containing protein [Triangularia verruculosa]|uniref:Ctf8-domain-containing protein n=1 Tax=Triangularia verruculosa TaxID=2587418 RepID=A0AAN7ATX6_9PEZI|nr:Ctf8-domain-containing protein [Triangularia verruculosa]
MPTSISLHPPTTPLTPAPSPLPQLLRTPNGLALLELQGTINLPQSDSPEPLQIGQLAFPDYIEGETKPGEGPWMKKVYMYIGQHQKLFGEVKKLPAPVAVVRKRAASGQGQGEEEGVEELEIVEVVRWKLVFSGRPEPVTSSYFEREEDAEMVG